MEPLRESISDSSPQNTTTECRTRDLMRSWLEWDGTSPYDPYDWTCPFEDCRHKNESFFWAVKCGSCCRSKYTWSDKIWLRNTRHLINPLLWIDFDALIEQAILRIQLAISIVRYLIQLEFSTQSVFPGTIRPPCTTMPWMIWPSLVVLWGVCWMFYYGETSSQFQTDGIPHSEVEEVQRGTSTRSAKTS
jgi:hypothetical protein